MALRAKTASGEAEDDERGHSKARTTTKAEAVFAASAEGRGRFPRFPRRPSLADARYASLLAPGTRKNRLPSPEVRVVRTGPRLRRSVGVERFCSASQKQMARADRVSPHQKIMVPSDPRSQLALQPACS